MSNTLEVYTLTRSQAAKSDGRKALGFDGNEGKLDQSRERLPLASQQIQCRFN